MLSGCLPDATNRPRTSVCAAIRFGGRTPTSAPKDGIQQSSVTDLASPLLPNELTPLGPALRHVLTLTVQRERTKIESIDLHLKGELGETPRRLWVQARTQPTRPGVVHTPSLLIKPFGGLRSWRHHSSAVETSRRKRPALHNKGKVVQ